MERRELQQEMFQLAEASSLILAAARGAIGAPSMETSPPGEYTSIFGDQDSENEEVPAHHPAAVWSILLTS
jgi:hypothetical protein